MGQTGGAECGFACLLVSFLSIGGGFGVCLKRCAKVASGDSFAECLVVASAFGGGSRAAGHCYYRDSGSSGGSCSLFRLAAATNGVPRTVYIRWHPTTWHYHPVEIGVPRTVCIRLHPTSWHYHPVEITRKRSFD
jgi:hypothetical protein